MFDEDINSNCESENLIYRLYMKFLKGATQEQALNEILKEDYQKEDLPPKTDE